MSRSLIAVVAGAAVFGAGVVWLLGRAGVVKSPGPSAWREVAVADLAGAQAAQYERAGAARNALFGSLMGELMEAMSAGGASGAIEVCAERAPRIAADVSQAHDVRIGRTSWKRRNAANTAPAWAQAFVSARVEEERVVVDGSGRMGVLLAIRVAPTCLECHGVQADLAPDVVAELERRYPGDEATGFAAGDLRGWFWVEVPAAAAPGS